MTPGLRRLPALTAAGLVVLMSLGLLSTAPVVRAITAGPIPLGRVAPFAVFAGTPAVRSSGPTAITGDLGIYPSPTVAGFPSGTVSGTIHRADKVAIGASHDLQAAYTDAATRPPTATRAALGGVTLAPGVYASGDAPIGLLGTLTLDAAGDPNAMWLFQATSDLATAAASTVRLVNGAQACNVFWQVAGSATLGAGSTFAGTILAVASITLGDSVTLAGRALARDGDVTMVNDRIAPTCSTIDPGVAAGVVEAAPPATRAPAAVTLPRDDHGASAVAIGIAAIVLILLAAVLAEPPRRRKKVRADFRWRDPSNPW